MAACLRLGLGMSPSSPACWLHCALFSACVYNMGCNMSKRLQASGCKLAPQCQDTQTPGGCQLLHVHDAKKPLQHAAQLVQARCARSLSAATHKMTCMHSISAGSLRTQGSS